MDTLPAKGAGHANQRTASAPDNRPRRARAPSRGLSHSRRRAAAAAPWRSARSRTTATHAAPRPTRGGCPTSRGGGAPGEHVGRRGARETTRRGDGVAASERSSAAQVADAQNWEQRVKSELEASKQWYKDWGSLYAPSQPTNYQDRIEKLQAKADEIPGVRLQTNNSIYGTGKPFKEFVTVKEKKPDLF